MSRPPSAFAALYLPSATGGTQAGLIARDWLRFDVVDGPIMGIVVGRPTAEQQSEFKFYQEMVTKLTAAAAGI